MADEAEMWLILLILLYPPMLAEFHSHFSVWTAKMIEHLGDGPYFGGLSEPSLLDFAILPQVTFDYMVGITDQLAINEIPVMAKWIESVMQYLPENPLLVPDFMVINSINARK
ncbi:MAG: hypothetical protein ABGY43_13365 [bacterium]|jgi:hypothetical protein|nr:hypothetical protein [Gammaproteobacteria bacterium]HIL84665.1 hypothetical protein [Pseudomonadales bacterium]